MPEDELERSEVEALLETRRELGLRYERELVDGFAERIERAVDRRVSEDSGYRSRELRMQDDAGKRQLALGIVSVTAGIPISAIALVQAEGGSGVVALIVSWAGLVGVNWAHARQSRPHRRDR